MACNVIKQKLERDGAQHEDSRPIDSGLSTRLVSKVRVLLQKSAKNLFLLSMLAVSPVAQAAVTINIYESGTNVIAEATGTLDMSSYSGPDDTVGSSSLPTGNGLVRGPSTIWSSLLQVGTTGFGYAYCIDANGGMFASGESFPADFGSGFWLGVVSGVTSPVCGNTDILYLAPRYVQFPPIAAETISIWYDQTIPGLSLVPGTYVYTWGSGEQADSLTVQVGFSQNEACDNGIDDDGDGQVDAEDSECAPPVANLLTRCFHTPVYVPTVGEVVTIEAEAIDENGVPVDVEFLEIYLSFDRDSPQVQEVNTSKISLEYPPAGSFAYACRASTAGGDQEFFSGWKRVGVDEPDEDFPAVPVRLSGKLDERIDIVFFYDKDEYSSYEDPAFIEDVGLLIQDGYFTIPEFVRWQRFFNFWIAKEPANSGPDPDDNDPSDGIRCLREPPDDLKKKYSFADTVALVHREYCRDNAGWPGAFTIWMNLDRLQVVAHETGHRPFGLADEYCCDGGYFASFETNPFPNLFVEAPFPNLFVSESGCRAAALDGGFDEENCRLIDSSPESENWWLHEPRKNDLVPIEGDWMQQTGCFSIFNSSLCGEIKGKTQQGMEVDPNGLYACGEPIEEFYHSDTNWDGRVQQEEIIWICRDPGDAFNAKWEINGPADGRVDRYRVGDSERRRMYWYFGECLEGRC